MAAVLLTWNPKKWPWETLDEELSKLRAGSMSRPWKCANQKDVQPGDRFFLIKQGSEMPKGIVGFGAVKEMIPDAPHWDKEKSANGKRDSFVVADFEALVDGRHEVMLSTSALEDQYEGRLKTGTQLSGILIDSDIADDLFRRLMDAPRRSSHVERPSMEMNGRQEPVALSGSPGASSGDVVDEALATFVDARERALREVAVRQGQPKFRQKLIDAYDGLCAVTGYNVVEALEAAHIDPYMGDHTDVVSNGLLLRSDIHSLFDQDLIAIEPRTHRIRLAEKLRQSRYNYLDGKEANLPPIPGQRPSQAALSRRWLAFNGDETAFGALKERPLRADGEL